ncbi:uncharacterized protein LOC116413266 [Galleria mellonella]|uniref:Uncharacterized protein LOC116413266 n=1 Tax=Galleria mellonella TaxID=7137 RepID=A0ABM3MMP0_GALME|nr:uncharacterized protein LOC116413266 [Galleria mellonella]
MLQFQLYFELFLLVLYCHNNVSCAAYSAEDSDEDLKQALLLVEILKSEYGKLLREKNEADKNTENVDGLTCATTNEARTDATVPRLMQWTGDGSIGVTEEKLWPTNANLEMSTSMPGTTSTPFSMLTHGPLLPYNPNFRRRINLPLGKHDRRQLRFDYEDPFGGHPEQTAKPATYQDVWTTVSTIVESSTTSINPKRPTTLSTTTEINLPETNPSTQDIVTVSTSRYINNTIKKMTSLSTPYKVKLRITKTTKEFNTEKSIFKNPIIDQVAAELISELKGDQLLFTSKTKGKNTRKTRKPLYLLKNKEIYEERPSTYRQKTTLKVHLAGSSRYPIPFPDNHAFCHTNPYNPLYEHAPPAATQWLCGPHVLHLNGYYHFRNGESACECLVAARRERPRAPTRPRPLV